MAEGAELNGHPSAYGNAIVLLSLIGLLHLPFGVLYLYYMKRDIPILCKIAEEDAGLPGPAHESKPGALARPATTAQPLLSDGEAPGAGYGTAHSS